MLPVLNSVTAVRTWRCQGGGALVAREVDAQWLVMAA